MAPASFAAPENAQRGRRVSSSPVDRGRPFRGHDGPHRAACVFGARSTRSAFRASSTGRNRCPWRVPTWEGVLRTVSAGGLRGGRASRDPGVDRFRAERSAAELGMASRARGASPDLGRSQSRRQRTRNSPADWSWAGLSASGQSALRSGPPASVRGRLIGRCQVRVSRAHVARQSAVIESIRYSRCRAHVDPRASNCNR